MHSALESGYRLVLLSSRQHAVKQKSAKFSKRRVNCCIALERAVVVHRHHIHVVSMPPILQVSIRIIATLNII
jgi:hypothetical protein